MVREPSDLVRVFVYSEPSWVEEEEEAAAEDVVGAGVIAAPGWRRISVGLESCRADVGTKRALRSTGLPPCLALRPGTGC